MVFFERLWGGTHAGLRSAENLGPFSFRSLLNKSIKSIANYRNRSKLTINYCHFFNVYLFFRVNKTNAWIHPAVSERGTNMYLARASVFYHTAVQA